MADLFGLVGSVLSQKYRVDRVIGEGGYGVVYAGVHLVLRQPVAIKCLKTWDAAAVDAFSREAEILFLLNHPAIVRLFDVGVLAHPLGPVPWVVLELLPGVSLDADLRARAAAGRPVSAAELSRVFEPLLDAVAFAHERGVVHRDLKPSNVMLTGGDPPAKVLDFGTARAFGQRSLGQTGASPAYAAPEQWDASLGPTGPATDVFGLGMTLAEACTLSPALGGGGLPSLLAAAMDPARRPDLAAARPDLPPALAALVARALRVRPEERFPNAREMARAFRAALAPPAPAPPPRARVSPALVIVPAALVAFALAVAALVALAPSFVAARLPWLPVVARGLPDDGRAPLGLQTDPRAPPPTAPPPPAPPPANGPHVVLAPLSGLAPEYVPADVLGVERPHHAEMDRCAAAAVREGAFHGGIYVEISGTKDGVVTSTSCDVTADGRNLVTEDKNPGAIAFCTCASGAASAWRFPPTRGRVGLVTDFSLTLTYALVDRDAGTKE